ncbi:hypothetical protein TSUD_285890 [Trifolium subterraneum]|uniref:Transposase-associated domain-containing protein n=1 Tax=Trifolium subterraneum TaxID=3900 RepID=A0A2Z6PM52_TRISU|nr:hypothetical protein TSUD_285890 [Trifolium subterraneum]
MYDRCYDGGQVKEIFKLGVELFIDAVKQNPVVRKTRGIRCPCAVWQCRRIRSEDDIKYHLESKGFQPNYLIWTSHGETFPSDEGASSSAGPMALASQNYHGRYPFNAMNDMIELALDQNAKLVLDTTPIPVRGDLPQTFYETKQLVSKLGLGVKRIDCCINGFYPDFAKEPRNVRLGLCSDGFTPYTQVSGTPYSCWPIIVTPYNLPPEMCMSKSYMFLAAVIPGPSSPTVGIDIYLQPLIDDLKRLWEGVVTYDINRKQNFTMKAALMWTINDFPTYGMLSGWGTHGKLACPICMMDTKAFTLCSSGKATWFDCHRRFLPLNHSFRRNKYAFVKGQIETRLPPQYLTSEQVWDEVKDQENVEIIGVVASRPRGKTKDNDKAREDIERYCKRDDLCLVETSNGKKLKPRANYTLSVDEAKSVYLWVKQLKMSDGYSSNLVRCADVDNDLVDMFHSCGSTSSSTLHIRFEWTYHRTPTMKEMNQMLHLRPDGTWDSVRAARANTKIQAYIKEIKASEAALPPAQRKSIEVLHDMILDKFVEFSGGKHKGHVQGQGCTSSFIQRTPTGYVDVSMNSFNSSSSMSTGRSSQVESMAEIEQRLRAENQQYLATMRQEMRQEITNEIRAELIGSQHIPFENLSDQHQLQRQQQQTEGQVPEVQVLEGQAAEVQVVEEEEEVKMHKLMHFILLDLWNDVWLPLAVVKSASAFVSPSTNLVVTLAAAKWLKSASTVFHHFTAALAAANAYQRAFLRPLQAADKLDNFFTLWPFLAATKCLFSCSVQEVQDVIQTGITSLAENATEAEQTAHRALKKKDFKAMFFIHQCVDLVNF